MLVMALTLWGCGRLPRVADLRRMDFRAEAVIHRPTQEERVRVVHCPSEGTVEVSWILPEEMEGLTLSLVQGQWRATWYGKETAGGGLSEAVAPLEALLAPGEWRAVAYGTYRGRDAVFVSLCEGELSLYMDRAGAVPLGMFFGETEIEFLWLEEVKQGG